MFNVTLAVRHCHGLLSSCERTSTVDVDVVIHVISVEAHELNNQGLVTTVPKRRSPYNTLSDWKTYMWLNDTPYHLENQIRMLNRGKNDRRTEAWVDQTFLSQYFVYTGDPYLHAW